MPEKNGSYRGVDFCTFMGDYPLGEEKTVKIHGSTITGIKSRKVKQLYKHGGESHQLKLDVTAPCEIDRITNKADSGHQGLCQRCMRYVKAFNTRPYDESMNGFGLSGELEKFSEFSGEKVRELTEKWGEDEWFKLTLVWASRQEPGIDNESDVLEARRTVNGMTNIGDAFTYKCAKLSSTELTRLMSFYASERMAASESSI